MKLDLAKIRIDGDIQPREELDQQTVTDYADAMQNGDKFPAVVVYHDGSNYWLVDGFHRVVAYARVNAKKIDAEIHKGTKRDAQLAALEFNAKHGLRRSNADKRRAVMRLLEDAEWSQWSDREIARRCGVSPTSVGTYRSDLSVQVGQIQGERKVERSGRVYVQNTANIGRTHTDDEYEEVIIDEETGEVLDEPAIPSMRTVPGRTKLPPFQPAKDMICYVGLDTTDLDKAAGILMQELGQKLFKTLHDSMAKLL